MLVVVVCVVTRDSDTISCVFGTRYDTNLDCTAHDIILDIQKMHVSVGEGGEGAISTRGQQRPWAPPPPPREAGAAGEGRGPTREGV